MQNTICVCGAGTMGSGIAQIAAQNNYNIILFDVNENMLQTSRQNIEKNLAYLVEKNKIDDEKQKAVLNNIQFTSEIKNCIADIIIEAVVENKEIKEKLFADLYAVNKTKNNTIFATNTSSISITELCSDKPYAKQFAGMHFFNPATIMKLVEVIRAAQTKDEVIVSLCEFAKQLGKTPVVCNDAPGFIVNRVARPYYLEAMRIMEETNVDAAAIDKVMEATGFKMGPFKLMDLIGMDINYSVSEIVWEALGKPERLKPSIMQREKVKQGELGKKTGKGFYNY